MRSFENCLWNECNSLRFSYERQYPLFHKAYSDYAACVSTRLESANLSLYQSTKTNTNSFRPSQTPLPNSSSVGGITSTSIITQFYSTLIGIINDCQKQSHAQVKEIESVKECQETCLESAQHTSINSQTSLSLLFYVGMLILVFSAVTAIIVYLVYRYKQNKSTYIEHKNLEDTFKLASKSANLQEQDKSDSGEQTHDRKQEIMQNHPNHIHSQLPIQTSEFEQIATQISITKSPAKKKFLTRLNVDKMKQLLSHIREKNPSMNEFTHRFEEQTAKSSHTRTTTTTMNDHPSSNTPNDPGRMFSFANQTDEDDCSKNININNEKNQHENADPSSLSKPQGHRRWHRTETFGKENKSKVKLHQLGVEQNPDDSLEITTKRQPHSCKNAENRNNNNNNNYNNPFQVEALNWKQFRTRWNEKFPQKELSLNDESACKMKASVPSPQSFDHSKFDMNHSYAAHHIDSKHFNRQVDLDLNIDSIASSRTEDETASKVFSSSNGLKDRIIRGEQQNDSTQFHMQQRYTTASTPA